MRKLLYLHGFNSSPQSFKAKLVRQYMREKGLEQQLICPHIPAKPLEAQQFLLQLVENELSDHHFSLVGSSLGGYYATYLAETCSTRAVLINPSVRPYETLQAYLGENKFYYEDGVWDFTEEHIEQLTAMDITSPTYDRYMVLLQTGDEVLDYREAEEKYRQSYCIIEQGGNHSFLDLHRHLPDILEFCRINTD